jgi:Ca-activated chloride channel family protein
MALLLASGVLWARVVRICRERASSSAPLPIATAVVQPAVPMEEEIRPEVVPTLAVDGPEPEAEWLGDPGLAWTSQHSGAGGAAPFAGPGVEAPLCGGDSSIGVGGGSGGMFGGRGGSHKNLKMVGGGVTVSLDPGLPPGASAEAPEEANTESYDSIVENSFHRAVEDPLSTFSVDVDTASYSLVRRFLTEGRLPPRGAVRIEEMVNYFRYDLAPPPADGAEPFAVHVDAAAAPWAPAHRLVRIALKGRVPEESARPPANLVFLVDVSGSMQPENKLPLVKAGLRLLAGRLAPADRVAMVVYAGSSGLVLPSTPGSERAAILEALDRLEAGGSTNGGSGIRLAYAVARGQFLKGSINRVILATDGDFNVGVTSESDLTDLIEKEAKGGVFLTVLGVGTGNVKDSMMEKLADRGNGNYAYLDSLREAGRVLVEQAGATLQTIAKDVKIQVEFNPARVEAYRLLGYENRMLKARDFNDDTKDAGEIGAGHCVTALYEVVPAGLPAPGPTVDALRYQEGLRLSPSGEASGELLTVKLRWKEPDGDASRPSALPFVDGGAPFDAASGELRFAASVAAFGLVLRDSPNKGSASLDLVREIAAGALGTDDGGWRKEFLSLVEKAATLKR